MQVLEIVHLTKVYQGRRGQVAVRALDGMDLSVARGEFVSIMGPSGSGKTTLLNILAGLDRQTGGECWIDGRELSTMSNEELAVFRRQKLGFVFQDFNLIDTLTLAENVALPLALDGARGARLYERVVSVMADLGLDAVGDKYPYEVSGGQQQRAAVARAVVHEPALLLADEPTGNLDSASAQALLELFRALNRRRQATLLMVTHDPFSASYADRVVFIKDGRVHSELVRNGGREAFFQDILSGLAVLEGARA
ncbi:ABC transporter ATP-binding protein [Alicyclobacillus shizuokensis]|uniref:ABC transporter ATP-binding protein n=1 Tax=Alicyclobacillus shizuokensis TaxID=392014 RepID=UPI00082BA6AD|nr:ABC transporter ATP-binding protein [Alicyclobacillus shizuokensis]